MECCQSHGPVPDEVDVVVVGASTSGLLSAIRLREGGLSVAVLERKADLRRPVRTWIVTDHFREVLGSLPSQMHVHTTSKMDLIAGPVSCSVPLDPPDLIIDRSSLLQHLLDKALEMGVQVFSGVRFLGASHASHGIAIWARDEVQRALQITTRYLIGADGVRSAVARAFGGKPYPTVPVVQAVVRLPADYDPARTSCWFDPSLTPFFFWLIPDSAETGVLGLVAESARDARTVLTSFALRNGFEPLEFQGAMIPLHRPFRKVEWGKKGSRALLVGDAAGHVKVTTVGGVVPGLWGARACADSILQGRSYTAAMAGLQRELILHDVIRWMMDRFDARAYEEMLGLLTPELANFLSRQNRDTMAGAVHRLILAQPRLLLLGLRALGGRRRIRERKDLGLEVGVELPEASLTSGD